MPRPQKRVGKRTTTYYVRVRHQGRQTTETFPTEAAAWVFCNDIEAYGIAGAIAERSRRDRASDKYVPTLREQFADHLAQLTGVDERTPQDYRRLAERTFLPLLGNRRIDAIDRAAVATFIRELEHRPILTRKGRDTGRTLAAKSIANAHGLLSATMNTAVADGLIPANPCTRIRLPRSGEHERRDERFLTHAEYERLEAALPERWVPLVRTLVGTGLRWSEATALRASDINLEQGTLRVTRAWKRRDGKPDVIGPPKSRKSRRTVMLPRQVLDVIEPLMEPAEDGLLFTTPSGGRVLISNFRDRVWLPAVKRAGLSDVRVQDCRHSHASWLIEMGMPLEAVQDQLGHESILTTRKVYAHLQPSMRLALQEAATRALMPTAITGPQ